MGLTFDLIHQGAREATGLPDPDIDSWREGLEYLLHDHAKAGVLTERGEKLLQGRYTKALSSRMQIDDFLRRNPDVAKSTVHRPVFIIGMVRTGTTMVSYLMDSDPANRSLLRWEAYNVGPPAHPGALRTDPRCLVEKAQDEKMIQANPQAAAAHFEFADGPTECVHLLAQDFRSMMFAVLSDTPTYHDWVLFCDKTTSYGHRKRVLQILQTTNPGRWVLKMPSDTVFIRDLFRVFPDARVIWTHRDPYAAFASSMSMRGRSRLIFNKDTGLELMRSRFPLQLGLHTRRPLEMSQKRSDAFYHLYYDELVSDPIAQMRKVYAWLDFEWTGAAEQGMRTWLKQNPQGRLGAHKYSLAGWGFTKKDIEPYFADYLKVHPVATGAST
jgi:hypothetical protein